MIGKRKYTLQDKHSGSASDVEKHLDKHAVERAKAFGGGEVKKKGRTITRTRKAK